MQKVSYKGIKVNGKKMDFHRYIMEVHLGRKLNRNEHVHHIDGNKLNNDISNLQILTPKEHAQIHLTGVKIRPEVIIKREANKKLKKLQSQITQP